MKNFIEEIENQTKVSEHDISDILRKYVPENDVIPFELHAEALAFGFVENLSGEKNEWNTYYKPMIVWKNDDGSITESPSIAQVNQDILNYWHKRKDESRNPLLKARYCGLIWDFTKSVTNNNPEYKVGISYVESLINTVENRLFHYEIELVIKIKRAVNVACSLNQPELIEKAKKITVELEEEFSKNEKNNLWGFSFDYLLGNKRIVLTSEEELGIINKLHVRFNKLSSKDNLNPWDAEYAAKRLCDYYKKKNRTDIIKEIMLQLGAAFELKEADSSAMQISSWLRHLYKVYTNYGLNEEVKNLLRRLQELGPKINDELSLTESSFNIPKEKMDGFVDLMTTESKTEIINNIINRFIPKKDEVRERMFEMAKKTPFNYIVPITLQDAKGRVVATIGSLEDDIDGRLIMELSEDLSYEAIFLRHVFYKITSSKLLDTNDILEFIEKSPVFEESRLKIIARGLDAYFSDDLIVAIHLLIPQIEEAIRNLIEMSGGIIFKAARDKGGFQLKTFNELLGDEIVKMVFNEDIQIYLRVLFTDQRGWNIRNDVCHGICDINSFTYQSIERIIHILMILGVLRKK
ncbi:DUF4209 domain-containing protein [Maribellus sp. YY47]|uniref:DUF4209 domain-containing protein n=1 Tax=Maribellus sp. YY47 TaxID=2929486 RepID=UPI0020018F96|nr:DUF4209 domain-containing protein [Maribellus sp. YY47]MCK3684230.1 DUF4209 domain-containing protein [Maribellus sp. YY47]